MNTPPVSSPTGGLFRLWPAQPPARPVVVSIPHTGTWLPEALRGNFRGESQARLPMTDWHLAALYEFLPRLGITVLVAEVSRYVVDLNRDPHERPLYPGRFETTLVPRWDFTGEEIWRVPPTPDEIAARCETYFRPYHRRLQALLEDSLSRFGSVLLLDLHSVASGPNRIARTLAHEIFLGDRDGITAPPIVRASFTEAYLEEGLRVSANDPYKGGYITAHYGTSYPGVCALQIEMAERVYMDEEHPEVLDEKRLAHARELLQRVFLRTLDRLAPRGGPLLAEVRRAGEAAKTSSRERKP